MKSLCIMTMAWICIAASASAQPYMQNPQNAGSAPAAPVQYQAAPPQAAAPAGAPASTFPQLPPSSPCKKEDIAGIWQVEYVYEEPAGAEQGGFAREPYQYLGLFQDNLSGKISGAREMPLDQVRSQMRDAPNKILEQFSVKDGFIYFYKDQVAVDNWACFIVANPRGSFTIGQMLLMPPQQQAYGRRLVKVYKNLSRPNGPAGPRPPSDSQPAAPATTNPAPPTVTPPAVNLPAAPASSAAPAAVIQSPAAPAAIPALPKVSAPVNPPPAMAAPAQPPAAAVSAPQPEKKP